VAVAVAAYFLHYRRVQMPEIEQPILLATQDLLIFLSSMVEVVLIQLVSPGTLINFVLIGMISQRTWDRIDFSEGAYFGLIWLCYALLGLWLLTAVVSLCRKFKPLSFDIQLIGSVLERALSFVIIFCLLTLYDCNKAAARGSDEDIEDSYMDIDCTEDCWSGKHMHYAVANCLVLGVYLLVCIPASYYLSNILEGHQFMTSKFYALIRQPFILAFIALHKSKQVFSDVTYSVAFLVVLSVYFVLCMKGRVFNLKNLNLWHNTLLVAVLIISTTSVLNDLAYTQFWLWFSLTLVLLLVLIGFAVLKSKRLPKMTIQPSKVNITALLNFAFRFNQTFPKSTLIIEPERQEKTEPTN
jgi:hypothetical protein